ncbi:MAG: butyrate kinase [Negativicutes bacterium]|nr:butyrate kinase [Negativicutes bacterium]
MRILAINPGSTSTKIAVYTDEHCDFVEVVRHRREELAPFARIADQYDFRLQMVKKALTDRGIRVSDLAAVVGRGGPLKPISGGVYAVNDLMCEDLRRGVQAEHASNLGGLLARGLAEPEGLPAFIVNPVSVDEMEDVARITGIPEIPRRSLFHALNLKAVARRVAADQNWPYEKMTLVMAHLGGGISIGVQTGGRMIDVENPNDDGPFSPERAGSVPSNGLVKLCFSGRYSQDEIKKMLAGNGGLVAHLGTSDVREVEQRLEQGDEKAGLVYEAMIYQIAKAIGAMATVVCGRVDAVVLTGGIAYSARLTDAIRKRVEFIAPVLIYPGEDEMQALAEGGLRALRGEEEVREYR